MIKQQKDKLLFHYCSNQTMMSIIKHKQLWMSDISRSNDFNELTIFLPDLYYAIEDKFDSNPFELLYSKNKGKQALQLILDDVDGFIGKALRSGRLTSFVTCFSEFGDRLGQWRGYANDGKGCSIGFSKKELEKYCSNNQGKIRLCKVKYINQAEAHDYVVAQADEILNLIRNLRTRVGETFNSNELSEEETELGMSILLYGTIEDFMLDSLQYKWDAFKEENEWRMFFSSITKDEKILFAEEHELPEWIKYDKDLILREKVDFYAKEDCVVTYFPVELKELSDSPIKKLFLGPKNTSYLHDIELLVAKEKIGKADVCKSSISYR